MEPYQYSCSKQKLKQLYAYGARYNLTMIYEIYFN